MASKKSVNSANLELRVMTRVNRTGWIDCEREGDCYIVGEIGLYRTLPLVTCLAMASSARPFRVLGGGEGGETLCRLGNK